MFFKVSVAIILVILGLGVLGVTGYILNLAEGVALIVAGIAYLAGK